MSISEINTNNALTMLGLQSSSNSVKTNSTGLDEISDDFSESDETSKFKEIVGKYDITNISRNEAAEMYKELYQNGLISLKDVLKATFDPTHIPNWQDGVSTINGVTVSSNPNKKTNLLESLEKQLNWAEKFGDKQSVENLKSSVELAEKINYLQS